MMPPVTQLLMIIDWVGPFTPVPMIAHGETTTQIPSKTLTQLIHG